MYLPWYTFQLIVSIYKCEKINEYNTEETILTIRWANTGCMEIDLVKDN